MCLYFWNTENSKGNELVEIRVEIYLLKMILPCTSTYDLWKLVFYDAKNIFINSSISNYNKSESKIKCF